MKIAKLAMCFGSLGLIDNQGDGVGVGVAVGVGVGVDVVASVGVALALALSLGEGVGVGVNAVLGTGPVAGPEPHSAPIEVNFTPV